MEPEITFCYPEKLIKVDRISEERIVATRIPEDLNYPVKLYTTIRGRWQYREVPVGSQDKLRLEIDPDWYETSVSVFKGDMLVGHVAREMSRVVANFLKFHGYIFPVIYDEIEGKPNRSVWSLRAGGLEIGMILYFDCKTSADAKDLMRYFQRHHCHYIPQLTKKNCPEDLKKLFNED